MKRLVLTGDLASDFVRGYIDGTLVLELSSEVEFLQTHSTQSMVGLFSFSASTFVPPQTPPWNCGELVAEVSAVALFGRAMLHAEVSALGGVGAATSIDVVLLSTAISLTEQHGIDRKAATRWRSSAPCLAPSKSSCRRRALVDRSKCSCFRVSCASGL